MDSPLDSNMKKDRVHGGCNVAPYFVSLLQAREILLCVVDDAQLMVIKLCRVYFELFNSLVEPVAHTVLHVSSHPYIY